MDVFHVPSFRSNPTVRSVLIQDKASFWGDEWTGVSTGDIHEMRKNSDTKHCPENMYGNLCRVSSCRQPVRE
jgi:hypothetical protein